MSQTKAELIKGLNINASAPATSLQIDASGNVNIDSNTLYVDATNNRVGIGTTAPQGILNVTKSGASTTPNLVLTSGGAGDPSSVDPSIQFSASGAESLGTTKILSTGAYNARALAFHTGTDAAGTERARIDSSGRLLVGTSTARSNIAQFADPYFQIEGTYQRTISVVNNENNANASGIALSKIRGTGIVSNGDISGLISFGGFDGSTFRETANIQGVVDGTPGANDMPGRLVFSTTADGANSPTIRTEIKTNGAFRTVADTGIDVIYATTPSAAGTSVAIYRGLRSGTAGTPGSGTDVFLVFSNGTVQNATGTYTTISDAKLKENIVDANSQWNDLKNIKIRNWNFKEETGQETHRQLGPIAQELEEVCPGLVFEVPDKDEDGNELGTATKGVLQSVLYMKAVKALQEAMERIETLEAKVAALEAA